MGDTISYNGKTTNYDFGRYHGKYQGSWYKGPNIMRATTGIPQSLSKTGGKIFEFDISQKLDNIIADAFKAEFKSGKIDIPSEVKAKMEDPSSLKSNERYMGTDWGIFGPNCITKSFEIINKALDSVINGNYPEDLKNEAKQLKAALAVAAKSLTNDAVKQNLELSETRFNKAKEEDKKKENDNDTE